MPFINVFLSFQAVISAPIDEKTGKSKELAVALANRSAVLFSLKAFHLALDDIRLALESGYPEELQFKLLERKAKILTFFKQFIDARDTYKLLLKSLDIAKVDENKKLNIQKNAQAALKHFDRAPSVYNDPNMIMKEQTNLPKLPDKNKKYPAISNAVCFKYEPGRGRYAIAQRDIKVGEFICVEKPIASHPLPEYLGSNCTHCFKSMKAPLPCPVSTKFLFCCYDCRAEALSTYHPYICKIIDFLIASGMSIVCFLAYKAVVQKPLKYFLDNRDKFESHDESSGVNIKLGEDGKPIEKYVSGDYKNYFNLVTHHEERKTGDIFHRAMLAVMLLKCMKRYGYFGPDADEDVLTEDECYIGTVLNHFLEVNQFNAHEVAQFEMIARNREEGSKSVYIGKFDTYDKYCSGHLLIFQVLLAILHWQCSIIHVIQALLGSILKIMFVSKPSKILEKGKKSVKIMAQFSFIHPKKIEFKGSSLNIGLIVVAYHAKKIGL